MLPRTIPIFLLALWTIPTMVSNASIENIDHALSQFKISKGAKLSDYLNRTYDWQEIDLRQCYDATFGRGTLIDIFKESLSQVIYKFFGIMHDKLKYEEPKNLTERVEIFLWNLKTLAGQIEGCMGEPADDRVVYGLTPMTYKSEAEYNRFFSYG